jgi:hypothetical protein
VVVVSVMRRKRSLAGPELEGERVAGPEAEDEHAALE